jgi:hypothetical protein
MTGSRGASRSLSIAADASEHRCRLMNDRGLTMTATVFLVLLAGHLLGDWVAQTDWQATTKTRSVGRRGCEDLCSHAGRALANGRVPTTSAVVDDRGAMAVFRRATRPSKHPRARAPGGQLLGTVGAAVPRLPARHPQVAAEYEALKRRLDVRYGTTAGATPRPRSRSSGRSSAGRRVGPGPGLAARAQRRLISPRLIDLGPHDGPSGSAA